MDWDICTIFDACRFDFYRDYVDNSGLEGRIDSRISNASSTPEFLSANFDAEYRDTVYVTANPQYHQHQDKLGATFHKSIHVWKTKWDDDLQTVTPGDLTDIVVETANEYPNKRILAHYIQPHVPFIGPFGQDKFPISLDGNEDGEWHAARKFWPSIRQDERTYSISDLRKAYRENLGLVANEVLPQLKQLDGKKIITSDHGQLLGERISPIPIRDFAHPAGIYVKELIEVPLHTLPYKSRRTVVEGDLESLGGVDEGISERLNALGYS